MRDLIAGCRVPWLARVFFHSFCAAVPVYPPLRAPPANHRGGPRAKQEAMASETDHGEALAGAHARYNPHTTAIPLLLAPRCLLSVPGSR